MIKKICAPGDDSNLTSFSLLVLRLCLGLTMFFVFGLDKLNHFNDFATKFPDPLHIGVKPGLALVTFAETAAALLLALGLLARFAALILVIDMAVAFFMVTKMAVGHDSHAQLAFLYLAGFVTLLLAGPGKISLDKAFFGKGK